MTPEMHRIALKSPKKALAHPFGAQKKDCCTVLCSSPCGVIRGYGAAVLAALLVSFPSADHFHAAYAAAGLEVAVLCGHQAGLHDPADGLQLCGICCHIVEQCSALGSMLACGGPQRTASC